MKTLFDIPIPEHITGKKCKDCKHFSRSRYNSAVWYNCHHPDNMLPSGSKRIRARQQACYRFEIEKQTEL